MSGVNFDQQSMDRLGTMDVEVSRRLVCKQERRRPSQGTRNRHPLLFATGQLSGSVIGPILQRYLFEKLAG